MAVPDPNQNSGTSDVIAAAIVTVVLSGLVVVLRFVTRFRILRFVGAEDWCVLVAYILSIGNTIGMTYQAKFALGRHVATLSPEQIVSCLKAYYATVIFYDMSLTFTKMSILLQYLRIFKIRNLLFACYALMAIVILYGLEMLITAAIPCWPVARFWNFTLKGWCLPATDIWFINAALNIATDVLIFMLPLPVINGLNLPRRQKAALLGVFMLGFFVCIISILRIPSLKKAAVSTDFSFDNIGIAVWSCIEVNIAIMCACLPALKPLISHFFPRLLSTAGRSGTSRSNYWRYASGRDGGNSKTTASASTWNKNIMVKNETVVEITSKEERGRSDAGSEERALGLEGLELEFQGPKGERKEDLGR